MGETVTDPLPNRQVAKTTNPWGVAALVTAFLILVIKYLRNNSLSVFQLLLASSSLSPYITDAEIIIVNSNLLPFLPIAFGVIGILLARGRSKRLCVEGILLAVVCFGMMEISDRNHRARLGSFERITDGIEQYYLTNKKYPTDLTTLSDLTNDDLGLVEYLPGASRNEIVRWRSEVHFGVYESPRIVCLLNDVTFGTRFFYLANGKRANEASVDQFEPLLAASRKGQHEP